MTATILIVGDAPAPWPGADADVGRFDTWGDDAAVWFDARLAAAMVGWRCTVVGPEAVVRSATARAVAAGAVPDELSVVVTDSVTRRVYCPSCGVVTATSSSAVTCGGCAVELIVSEHFSPVLAAHLGSPC